MDTIVIYNITWIALGLVFLALIDCWLISRADKRKKEEEEL